MGVRIKIYPSTWSQFYHSYYLSVTGIDFWHTMKILLTWRKFPSKDKFHVTRRILLSNKSFFQIQEQFSHDRNNIIFVMYFSFSLSLNKVFFFKFNSLGYWPFTNNEATFHLPKQMLSSIYSKSRCSFISKKRCHLLYT